MRFGEAIRWCVEHNAHVVFTHDMTVQIKIDAFEGFIEGYHFCNAVEAAHEKLINVEIEDSGVASSTLKTRDTQVEGE